MDLRKIQEKAQELIINTGLFLEQEQQKIRSSGVRSKSINQLVTYVDEQAEQRLAESLLHILPQSGILGEEAAQNRETLSGYTWIIDPLDGTTNYIHGLPIYCISVGLLLESEVVAGIIYDPIRKELFTASQGNGAFLNTKPIRVKPNAQIQDSLLATGFPYYDFGKTPAYLKVLDTLMKNTRGLRRMGSAAIDLAYVACGRFDAFFEYSLAPWDVAAGACIVSEAGGMVSDFGGTQNYLYGKEIIASNLALHPYLQSLIFEHFYNSHP